MEKIFRSFFYFLFFSLFRIFYPLRVNGINNFPKEGGVLLLSNHVSYIDAFVIYFSSPRPVAFVVLEDYMKIKSIGWFLNLFDSIPINPKSSRGSINKIIESLNCGKVVCFFPEGGLTRTGVIKSFKRGFELIAKKSKCLIVPVYMDGLWNSIFSFERGVYFKKKPNNMTCPIQVSFGKPISHENISSEILRKSMLDQSVKAFEMRRDFDISFRKSIIKNLKIKKNKNFLIELKKTNKKKWTRSNILALSITVCRNWIKKKEYLNDKKDSIAIFLPSGAINTIISQGIILSGSSLINLEFSLNKEEGHVLFEKLKNYDIKTIITAKTFSGYFKLFRNFLDGVNYIYINELIDSPFNFTLNFERLLSFIEPYQLSSWRLGLDDEIDDKSIGFLSNKIDEDLYFISYSQIHTNAVQVASANFICKDEIIFIEDGYFTTKEAIFGNWNSIFNFSTIVMRSFSNRNNDSILNEVIIKENVTNIISNKETFYKIHLNSKINNLKYGIIFDHISSKDLKKLKKENSITVLRAKTINGRVITMSTLDPTCNEKNNIHHYQYGNKEDSCGQFLPGISYKECGGDSIEIIFPVKLRSKENVRVVINKNSFRIDEDNFIFFNSK